MEEIKKGHRYFETQGADEKVLIVARRHWTVYTPALAGTLFVYVMAIVFFFNVEGIGFIAKNPALKASAVVFFSLFLLFSTLFIYINWLVNYLNIQIVTNMHVVDIDQFGLFSRKISELALDEIQDISATQKGVMQSFLNYGDICIQTAGEKPNFNFEKVPNPNELSRRIMEIKDEHIKSEYHRREQQNQPMMPSTHTEESVAPQNPVDGEQDFSFQQTGQEAQVSSSAPTPEYHHPEQESQGTVSAEAYTDSRQGNEETNF